MGATGCPRVCRPSILRIWIWPGARSARNSIGTVSAQGRTAWVLMRRRNASFRRSMAFVVRADFHCSGGQAGGGEQPLPVRGACAAPPGPRSPLTLEAVGDRAALQPPLPQEGVAAGLHLGRGAGVDHVAVILGELVVQVPGRVAEEVAQLVDGAALDPEVLAPQRDRPIVGKTVHWTDF